MQDKTDNQPDPEVAAGSGARLHKAREIAAISVNEVADELHLDRDIILAMEAEDFAVLGAPVFVKGHLRSYARLLNLPEDEIVGSYHGSEPEHDEFRTRSAQTVVKSGANLSNFVLMVILTIIVLIGVIYFVAGDEEVEQQDFIEIPPAATQLEQAEQEPGEPPDVEREPVIMVQPVAAEESVAAATAPESGPAAEVVQPAPQPESQMVSLRLEFSAECWVEISDSQRRLLYGLEKEGVTRVLDGVPPFRLFLGNTEAVALSIEGQSYEVPRAVRTRNNTARFAINETIIARTREQ
jgi:cytoskeleton protein RodZ